MSSRNSLSSVLCVGLWLACLLSSLAFAQAVKPTPTNAVLASASTEQVHFIALGETIQVRLEVFSVAGERLYDSDFKSGNLLDWNLHDQQGQRLLDGSYRCLVTSKTLAGQLSQKHGLIVLQAGQAALQPPDQDLLALFSANSSTPLERADFLTIVSAETNWPLTLVAHDGEQGRVVSGRGGLSFRTGDFFAGKDQEQMQLTPDGKLGLGVAEPQAKLDVAGAIRTSEGIVFPDGSVQTTAYVASGRSLSDLGERSRLQRDAQGRPVESELGEARNAAPASPAAPTGTAGRIAKFVDSVNLGDSSIIETFSGGINVATFGSTTATVAAANHVVEIVASGGKTPLTLVGGSGSMEFWKDTAASKAVAFGMARPGLGSSDDMVFSAWNGVAWAERMRMTNSGNLGIGTGTPGFPLTFPNTVGDKISLWGQSGNHYGFGIQGSLLQIHSGSSGDDIAFGYGTSASFSEIMRIKGTGNVGIGTNNPGHLLDVAGRMRVRRSGGDSAGIWFGVQAEANGDSAYGLYGLSTNGYGVVGQSANGLAGLFFGNVTINGNAIVTGTLSNNSDARLKQDVVNLGYGLREVLQLRPVTWHWKDKPAGKLQLGLIAQEMQQVLPELVTEGKDEAKMLSLNYLGLTPVLIKAIQEQQTVLEQKEAAIKALQQRNAELDARLAALEQTLQQLLSQSQPGKRQ